MPPWGALTSFFFFFLTNKQKFIYLFIFSGGPSMCSAREDAPGKRLRAFVKTNVSTNIKSETPLRAHILKEWSVRPCCGGSLRCPRLRSCTHPQPSYLPPTTLPPPQPTQPPRSPAPTVLQETQRIDAWILNRQQNYNRYIIDGPKLHKVIKSGWVHLANNPLWRPSGQRARTSGTHPPRQAEPP